MILEFYFTVFVGFRFVVRPIIYKKSLFSTPIDLIQICFTRF